MSVAAGYGEDMFGRDSDSEPSESSEEAVDGAIPAPTGGVAAGGFLGLVANPEAGGGGSPPPPEGKAREGEVKDEEEDSLPPQGQGGAQPKKTLPRPVYEGKADTLVEMLEEAIDAGEEPDIAKIRELLDAGIDVRYQVRVHCVCVCLYWWYSTDMHE